MTDLKDKFQALADCWRRRTDDVLGAMDTLERRLGREAMRSDPFLFEARVALEAAIAELLRRTAEPELVLAMTGTTSSAKSTLGNFLIGDKLLPFAVEEMSAGVVMVRHHATLRRLRITPTVGATWDTGEWMDADADDIRKRLAATMEAYRLAEGKAREAGEAIEPVRFEIDWPIRMAQQTQTFGLPEKTNLTILDLPGLNSVSDERNRIVIENNIRQAVCLVAYDCAETDGTKQEMLLNQVIEQVRTLRTERSAVARMMFLLNKADIFLKNEDPKHSLGAFRTKVTQQLRDGLLQHLIEDQAVIEGIDPIELAPGAAFLAVAAARAKSFEISVSYLDEIETHFKYLFPRAYWKDWPRDFVDASSEQRQRLIADTLRHAKADVFEQRLSQHMAENLPEILMDDAVRAAEKAEASFLIRLGQFIDTRTKYTSEEAEKKLRSLAEISDELRREERQIRETFEELSNITQKNSTWTFSLGNKKLEMLIGAANVMKPIEAISLAVTTKPFHTAQDYCIAALENKNPVPPPAMIRAPNLEQLKQTLDRLRATPYTKFAENGGQLDDGKDAEHVKVALRDLVRDLSDICHFMMKAETEISGARIEKVFQDLTDHLLRRASEQGNKALAGPLSDFPGLGSIFSGSVTLPSFEAAKSLVFDLNIGASVRDEKRQETVIRHERSYWTLFLWRHKVKVTVDKIVSITGVEIPGLGEVINPKYNQKDLLKPFGDYLLSCIQTVEKDVKRRLDVGIGGYESAITQNMEQIKARTRHDHDILDETKRVIASLETGEIRNGTPYKPWPYEAERVVA